MCNYFESRPMDHICCICSSGGHFVLGAVWQFWERALRGTFARNFFLGQQFRRYQLKNFIFLASKQNCLTHRISKKLILKKNQQTTKRYAKITKSEIRRPATGNKKKSAGGKRRLRSAIGNKKIAVENKEKDWRWEIKKKSAVGNRKTKISNGK